MVGDQITGDEVAVGVQDFLETQDAGRVSLLSKPSSSQCTSKEAAGPLSAGSWAILTSSLGSWKADRG